MKDEIAGGGGSCCSVTKMCLILWPHGLQHTRPPSPSPSHSLPKFMSTESVMPSKHFILCRPLLLLPSIFLSIRIFFNELVLCLWWANYWSFSISPSNKYSGLISFRIGLISLLPKGLSGVISSTIVQKHQFCALTSLWSNSHIHMWLLERPSI